MDFYCTQLRDFIHLTQSLIRCIMLKEEDGMVIKEVDILVRNRGKVAFAAGALLASAATAGFVFLLIAWFQKIFP